ncbi:MAG TPA: hypothetical protein VGI40_28170 [Pirellulaceae bacterium]|jgi:hypothetical protein
MNCLGDVVLPQAVITLLAGRERDRIAELVDSAVTAIEPTRRTTERRREPRYPYPYPLHITPVAADGCSDASETFVVVGKHLAPHGVDFYSRKPVAHRRVIVSLDCGVEGWIGLLVELTWCRFGRHGWYDNGGRFLSVVPSPLTDFDDRPRAA